jgi:pimeloyl-ACP methyl ester carboxylesterase
MKLSHKHNNLGHKKTVVMFHSFPASSRIFHSQIPLWNEKFNTLYFDLPGFGYSKPLKSFSIQEYINPVRDLIDKYQIESENTIFYGVSFGGIIALEYSQKYHIPQIIFESTPFNKHMIHTKEFEAIDFLKRLTTKTNSLKLFQKELRENKLLQKLIVAVYNIVKPHSKHNLDEKELFFFMRHIDLNTFFEIANYFKVFNINKDLKANTSRKLFVYDKYDPTVPFKYFNRVISKLGEKIITEYEIHAPSTLFGKEMAPKLIAAVM